MSFRRRKPAIPDWQNDIVADIKSTGASSGAQMDIFNANRDQLTDPKR